MLSYNNIVLKYSKDKAFESSNYVTIYQNEGYAYYFQNSAWQTYLNMLNLVQVKDLALQSRYTKLLQAVIPKYGKELYVLVVLVSQQLNNIHTVEDVLDAVVADNQLAMNVISNLKQLVKSTELYSKLEEKVRGFEEINKQLKKECEELKQQCSQLKRENSELKGRLSYALPFCQKKSTGKWIYETRLPVLKNYKELNQYLQSQHFPTEKLILDKNVEINIPEHLSEPFREFIQSNYHYILEFIAIKFTQMIPYIQRYMKLKEEDSNE